MMHKANDRFAPVTGRRVRLLERPRPGVLVVNWSDARRCHYGEQIWRLGKAGTNGLCALSGAPIRKGDPVFKPNRRPPPLNADAMILQREVPESVGVDDSGSTLH